jgi:hypothetical protein
MATLSQMSITFLEQALLQNPTATFFPWSLTDFPFSTFPQGVPRASVVNSYQTAAMQLGAYDLVLLGGDNFQRANQHPLSLPWVNAPNGSGLQVVNNQCYPLGATTTCAAVFSGLGVVPNDQWCSITIGEFDEFIGASTATPLSLGLRATVASAFGYLFTLQNSASGPHSVATGSILGNSLHNEVSLGANCPLIKTGDVFTAVAVGTLIQLYQNGTLVMTLNDATYTSGYPGLSFAGVTFGSGAGTTSVASFSCGAAFGGPNLSIS